MERKFLVDQFQLPDLDPTQGRRIRDLYIQDSRMRLRSIETPGIGTQFKLCKKYGALQDGVEPIVNIYLSECEFATLANLPGHLIEKVRFRSQEGAVIFAIDIFGGPLNGLIVAEAEGETWQDLLTFDEPGWFAREVTSDPFFQGGNLCRISQAELTDQLRKEGV